MLSELRFEESPAPKQVPSGFRKAHNQPAGKQFRACPPAHQKFPAFDRLYFSARIYLHTFAKAMLGNI